jgi:hypothetical protein
MSRIVTVLFIYHRRKYLDLIYRRKMGIRSRKQNVENLYGAGSVTTGAKEVPDLHDM